MPGHPAHHSHTFHLCSWLSSRVPCGWQLAISLQVVFLMVGSWPFRFQVAFLIWQLVREHGYARNMINQKITAPDDLDGRCQIWDGSANYGTMVPNMGR